MFSSIINSNNSENSITRSLNKILKKNLVKKSVKEFKIFGSGNTSKGIAKKILSFDFEKYSKKDFHDI